ncbi:helix-turn-helix transcriptional regulator [Lysinibacillus sp. JNUCC-52]|uniref:helix-turn-helix transcriptional regulator n=1 Tax=Lysinibacillus sp. JNUCC-52 TaxID=2792480 RepID=UPI001937E3BA|nr:helix-turn-helix domain-containing protein [Lysinibacillus sp. JNUCC-52]
MVNNKVREIRQELGMSLSELARRTKTSRQTITNIELHGQEPGVRLGLLIANALNRNPNDIFFNEFVIRGLQKGKQIV